jgi:hypothetical protein
MALFLLLVRSVKDVPPDLAERLTKDYGSTHVFNLAQNAWVLSVDGGSSSELSKTIFPRDPDGKATTAHLVFSVRGSSGFFLRDFWEWGAGETNRE